MGRWLTWGVDSAGEMYDCCGGAGENGLGRQGGHFRQWGAWRVQTAWERETEALK